MVEQVGVRQLKESGSLSRAARGESILVTVRGRTVACIGPAAPPVPSGHAEALRAGRASWSARRPARPKRAPAVRGAGTIADLVVDGRR